MLKHTTIALITLVVAMSTVLPAANTATVLAKVLDDQTFAVARLKITSTQLDAIIQEILEGVKKHAGQEALEAVQGELKAFSTDAGQRLQDLEQAGASALYGVFSLRTLPGFLIVAPTHKDPGALVPIIKQIMPRTEVKILTHTNGPTLVVAGPASAVAQLANSAGSQPQALIDALATCHETSAVHLALAPCPEVRSVIKQMLPQLPLGPGSIPLEHLVDNLEWATLNLQAPPQTALNVTTHSANEADAGQLDTGIQEVYTLIKQMPQVRDMIPGIDAMFRHLTPTQQDRRLSLKVDQTTTEAIMKEALAASLVSIRRKTTQFTCGTNVSGLGKAVLIYANDHDDNLPLKLEDLREVEMTEKGMICTAVKTKNSYVYRGKGLNCSHSYDLIVLYDKKKNHDGTNHRNVLFLNSRVEWIEEDRFQALIRQDNAYRRKKGLPELPAR
ncbi:MAG: hypothetical protein HQ515_26270 [Phycisphaeraceae bacterium]|nr:hypothetical protein [Phycisphaeraceae bacterium]